MEGSKVLIVDDEPDVELLMKQRFRKQLRDKKFNFFFAKSGVEALKILDEEPGIHLVISDINMPEMDGLTLLKNINEKHPNVIPIIVSAYGDMNNIRAAMNLGAFDFVTKPINFDDLNITMDKTFQHIKYLLESMDNKDKLEGILYELNVAKDIQLSILPDKFINDQHIEMFAKMTPAKEVGGDFYDFFELENDKLGFVMGDVSGKGVPAALFMTVSRTILRAHAFNEESAGEALASSNTGLVKDNTNMMFVTTFYAILDRKTGIVQYANGGHNPPYIIRKNGPVEEVETTGDAALGVVEVDKYIDKETTLKEGDLIFLYTDGVTEACNAKEEYLGEKKLIELLDEYRDLAASELINTIRSEIDTFAAGFPQSDDITMLAIRYHKGKS